MLAFTAKDKDGRPKGTIPAEFGIVNVCLETGWDYWTYVSQPHWFVVYLELYLQEKNKAENAKSK